MHDYDPTGMTDRKWKELTGKLSPIEAIQAAVDRIAAGKSTRDEEIERLGLHFDTVRAQVEAERRAAQRLGLNVPAWEAGSVGIPSDRYVWAYIHSHGTGDIELLRGRDDDGDFMPPGEDWTDLHTGSVVCWFDAEQQPSFGVATVRAGIEAMQDRGSDQGRIEAWLHREALRAVVAGHPDAQAIAAAALESRTVKFTRYYS